MKKAQVVELIKQNNLTDEQLMLIYKIITGAIKQNKLR